MKLYFIISAMLAFLFGCSSTPSEEDGWVKDEEFSGMYVHKEKHTSEDSITQDFLDLHEGTWISNEYDDVALVIEEGEIFFGLHTSFYVLPINYFSLEVTDRLYESNDYEPTSPSYELNLGVPAFYNEYISKVNTLSSTINSEEIGHSDYSIILRVQSKDDNVVIYILEPSNIEFIKSADPVLQENAELAKSKEEDEADSSGLDTPYININDDTFELDSEGILNISGFYSHVDISQVEWSVSGKEVGNAEKVGDGNIEFLLSLSYDGIPVAEEESILLRGELDGVVYYNEVVVINTSNFMPPEEETQNEENITTENNDELDEFEDIQTPENEESSDILQAIEILINYFPESQDIYHQKGILYIIPSRDNYGSIIVENQYSASGPSEEWINLQQLILRASEDIVNNTEIDNPHLIFMHDIYSDTLIEVQNSKIMYDITN